MELMEKEVRIAKLEVGTKPQVAEQIDSGGNRCLEGCRVLSFHFLSLFIKILGMDSKV
jgi:hypothetical protein